LAGIEVQCRLHTTDRAEYPGPAEARNIRVMEIVAGAGTSLALPSRVLQVEQTVTGSRVPRSDGAGRSPDDA